MPNYARLAKTALRLISSAGIPVTLKKAVRDAYDPALGSVDKFKVLTYPGFSVRDPDSGATQAEDAGQGTGTAQTQKLLAVFNAGTPEVDDTITISGADWQIKSLTPIQPGTVVLLYEIMVKSG